MRGLRPDGRRLSVRSRPPRNAEHLTQANDATMKRSPAAADGGRSSIRSESRAQMGGLWGLWKAMRSKNACKTCALGMGGQKGGMVNEAGSFPEVCKKSLQAMAADMQGAIKPEFWSTYSVPQLQAFSPRELESCGRLVQPVRARDRRSNTTGRSRWDDALGRIVAQLQGRAARRDVLVLQRPLEQRGRLSAAALRPAVRHEQRQQLQLLLPPGQRRRPGDRRWAPARRRSRSRTSSTPTWCS